MIDLSELTTVDVPVRREDYFDVDVSGGGSVTMEAGWGTDGSGAVIIVGNLTTTGAGGEYQQRSLWIRCFQ